MINRLLKALVPIACLVFSAEAQQKTDAEALSLRGPVHNVRIELEKLAARSDKGAQEKRVLSSVSTFNEMGNVIEVSAHNSDGTIYRKYVPSYDPKGNKTEEIYYDPKGSLVSRYVFTYDPQGRRTERSQYNSKGSLEDKTVYTYDEKGRYTGSIRYDKKGSAESRTVYTYDAKGRVSEMVQYDAKGATEKRVIYGYAPSGNRVETARYNAKGLLEEKVIKTYNSNWDVIETMEYKSDGALHEKSVYTYDPNGNETEMVATGVGGVEKRVSTYEYDSNDNWTKKVTRQEVSMPDVGRISSVHTTYRTITYHAGSSNAQSARPLSNAPQSLADKIAPTPASDTVTQGSAVKRVEPSYPTAAKNRGISGAVLIEVTVDEIGDVIYARVKSGDSLLGSAAIVAAFKWKFTPTLLRGIPTKVIGTVTFNFNL